MVGVKWVYETKLNSDGSVQLDVKSAFLNDYLQEEIHVEQPQGFMVQGKALYDLKQTPRVWYTRIDDYVTEQGFRRSKNEPTLYIKT